VPLIGLYINRSAGTLQSGSKYKKSQPRFCCTQAEREPSRSHTAPPGLRQKPHENMERKHGTEFGHSTGLDSYLVSVRFVHQEHLAPDLDAGGLPLRAAPPAEPCQRLIRVPQPINGSLDTASHRPISTSHVAIETLGWEYEEGSICCTVLYYAGCAHCTN